MWRDQYVAEKLRDLEGARTRRVQHHAPQKPQPLLRPLIRVAGRTLRRAGEGLESWATLPGPEAGCHCDVSQPPMAAP